MHPRRPLLPARRATAGLVALALVAVLAACGEGKGTGAGTGRPTEVGDPVRGGSMTYGIEAESGGGWCLPESQLAISGALVARSVYDTLVVPDDQGRFVPYLAERVEPNEDFTVWTITVRDDVVFHDGTELTAEVVKNNLDAYRGAEGDHARSPLLGIFLYSDIVSVEVAGERDVVVTTAVPWVAFASYLYGSGRNGIMAQAQLDDTTACHRNLIGTGPFALEDPSDWVEGRELRLARNPDYWLDAPDGEPYPYLDELVFTPIIESEQRVNALLTGDVQIAHFGGADDIVQLRREAESGTVGTHESDTAADVGFMQLNTSRAPLDDVRIRRAMALAFDREDYQETIFHGEFTLANGPFAPGSPAFLEETGFPTEHDPDEARRLIADHEAEHGPLRTVEALVVPGPQEAYVFFQQAMAEVGITVELSVVQQDALIDRAISGEYDVMIFRNLASIDPDEVFNWFYGGSPVNFGRFSDPVVDELLDAGRSEPDPDVRAEIYQDLNRRLGEQAYALWQNFAGWMVAATPDVHGADPETAPVLPDGGTWADILADGHPTHGLWRTDG